MLVGRRCDDSVKMLFNFCCALAENLYHFLRHEGLYSKITIKCGPSIDSKALCLLGNKFKTLMLNRFGYLFINSVYTTLID